MILPILRKGRSVELEESQRRKRRRGGGDLHQELEGSRQACRAVDDRPYLHANQLQVQGTSEGLLHCDSVQGRHECSSERRGADDNAGYREA